MIICLNTGSIVMKMKLIILICGHCNIETNKQDLIINYSCIGISKDLARLRKILHVVACIYWICQDF